MRKFWFLCTFLGILIALAGFLLIEVLDFFSDDYSCQTANGTGTCSDDPTWLIGAIPVVVGGAMAGIGIWRIFASPDTGPALTIGRSRSAAAPTPPPMSPQQSARQQAQADAILAQYGLPGSAAPPADPPGAPPPKPE